MQEGHAIERRQASCIGAYVAGEVPWPSGLADLNTKWKNLPRKHSSRASENVVDTSPLERQGLPLV